LLAASWHSPGDFNTNLQMLLRWIHFLGGITWIGLLYFFNLVNVPLQKEMDAPTRAKVNPLLLSRALWWFRWAALVTVVAGVWYWSMIVGADARNAGVKSGGAFGSFFLVWTAAWALQFTAIKRAPNTPAINKGAVIGVIFAAVVIAGAWLYLSLNSAGWESNRMLSIGVGGGMGLLMLLNVWGLVWPAQKRILQWTRANAADGTPVPPQAAALARQAFLASRTNAWLSLPMLFFMGAASHYPILGK